MDDPHAKLPFIREILSSLRKEIGSEATLLGFIGTPWTLAAYAMEGKVRGGEGGEGSGSHFFSHVSCVFLRKMCLLDIF